MSSWTKPLRPWLPLAGVALAVFVLYAGRVILVPVAFALLLTFTLAPAADFLQRFIGRVASVIVVVVMTFSVLGAVGWTFTTQLVSLASDLPAYRENIRDKVRDIRLASRGGSLERVQDAVRDIQEEISASDEDQEPSDTEEPIKVVQTDPGGRFLGSRVTTGLLDGLASAAVIIVFVVFMLLDRNDLRNRLILLVGSGRLTLTTRALDEAGTRISRYLSRQALVNGTFGLGVGLGLYLLGVPYALLWACLAAVLRFAPYVGPWIGALAPILLSLAVFPDWTRPLMVVGLFVVAELFTNIVLETLVYSGAAGVTTIGLLVAIAFWTWLWGPLGLVMGTPLTVCLVVLGKYVPSMGFLVTLLGDEPGLKPDETYYQRLVAGDRDEASGIVETYLTRSAAAETVFDALVLPTLCYARRDVDAGQLTAQQEQSIARANARILDDILIGGAKEPRAGGPPGSGNTLTVLACPAASEADELALKCFQHLLAGHDVALEILSPDLLSSEVVELVRQRASSVVCVAALSLGEVNHARYLCKRLRAAFPGLKILVGRWGPPGLGGEGTQALLAAGADAVGATLLESRAQFLAITGIQARVPGAA